METLLTIFAQRRTDHAQVQLQEMERLIGRFDVLRSQAVLSQEPEFNLFSVLQFGTDEVALSSLLAWLMDERESHRQGNIFFKAFAEQCGLPLSPDMLTGYRVRKEYSGKESIIDIMIYRAPSYLIYVENKILASEGDDQTAREFRDMRQIGAGLRIPTDRQFAIFLTPEGRLPTTNKGNQWHSLSHADLAEAFLNNPVQSQKLRHILEDLKEITAKWSAYEETL